MAVKGETGLITLQQAKLYLGLGDSNTEADRLLDALVGQASQLVRREVGCDVLRKEYTLEEHQGQNSYYLYLDHWPLYAVNRVCLERVAGMTVAYAGDATHATVEVQRDKLRLRTCESGVWSTTELAYSDYATVTLIAAAVTALSGFTGTACSGYTGHPSTDLIHRPAIDCNDRTVDLYVPETPETDFEVNDEAWGILYNPYGWGAGRKGLWPSDPAGTRSRANSIYVDYEAGYARANIPEPIQGATQELVALLYQLSRKDPTLDSERIGDYSYKASTLAQGALEEGKLPGFFREKLLPYTRPCVVGV